MKRFALSLPILVFLHALVVSPLLVECMAADGRILVELIGIDPCHDQSGAIRISISPHSNTSRPAGAFEPADPCEDLILDFLNCTQISSDSVVLLPQFTAAIIQLDQSRLETILRSDACRVDRRASGVSVPGPRSSRTLRI